MFVRALRRHLTIRRHPRRYFSSSNSMADPYYVLGVDKNTDYDQVKKVFYSLANEYHPDKNPSPDAVRQFILIKQAFQNIKQMKGMTVSQNLQRSTSAHTSESTSRRPNVNQFSQADSEFKSQERDYRMEMEKTPQGQQYDHFRNSFKTIHDINDIKIRVEQGQMKDTTERFDLARERVKNSFWSDTSTSYLIMVIFGLGICFSLGNKAYSVFENSQSEKVMLHLMSNNQMHQIRSNDTASAEQLMLMKKQPQYNAYRVEQNVKMEPIRTLSAGLNRQQRVVSTEDLQSVL